jgi:hypothetical protein
MGVRLMGRFMLGVVLGGAVALIVARKTAGQGAEVFTLQRGPTLFALVIGALGGGLSVTLASQNQSKAALAVAGVTALLLSFVVLVIDTNAANAL